MAGKRGHVAPGLGEIRGQEISDWLRPASPWAGDLIDFIMERERRTRAGKGTSMPNGAVMRGDALPSSATLQDAEDAPAYWLDRRARVS